MPLTLGVRSFSEEGLKILLMSSEVRGTVTQCFSNRHFTYNFSLIQVFISYALFNTTRNKNDIQSGFIQSFYEITGKVSQK